MDYKVIFIENDKIKQIISRLEEGVMSLIPDRDMEKLAAYVDLLVKVESILKLDKEEMIGEYLKSQPSYGGYDAVVSALKERTELLKQFCEQFECRNRIDQRFYDLYYNVWNMGFDALYKQMVSNFTEYYASDTRNANALLTSYNRVGYWGALDYWTGNYELIYNRAKSLTDNADAMLWMYFSLADYTSKEVMYHVLHNWLTFSHKTLNEMPRNKFNQYFDYDIIGGDCGKVFVDAGACKGDTIDSFMSNFKSYSKIYSYEITPDTFEILKANTQKYQNVVCRQCGVANKAGKMYVNFCEDIGGNRLGDTGETEVEVVTLDEDVKERIDFIKMDVEGAEYDALLGARRHITEEHPKLAIAAYHNNVDIFRLAQLISGMYSGYRFYYRYYGGNLYPHDYVLYAIPTV